MPTFLFRQRIYIMVSTFVRHFGTGLSRATPRSEFSIEKVADEIFAIADDLSVWALHRGADFFLTPDTKLLASLSVVSEWATSQSYDPAAVNTFLLVADYYLVAHALAHGHTVVTHEIASTSTKKIKIPDACIGLGIKCMTPYEMLRRERARFVLEAKK